jgi:O-Antigen ligase
MSLTALVFLGVFALGSLLALVRYPIFGLLTYLWVFYNPPTERWWGSELPDLRWALVAGVIALVSAWRIHVPLSRPPWHANWGVGLLILFTIWLWVQNAWALDGAQQLFLSILFTKYIVVFYIVYRIVHDEKSLTLFFWANVIGCFIWGWDAYHATVSGRLEAIGGTDVSGANGASMQLLVGLILAGFLFLGQRGIKRWLLLVIIPFILNAIILTATRGAFVAMVTSGLAAFFFARRPYRLRVYAISTLAILLLFRLGNDLFWQRMGTLEATQEQQMEKSAQSRLVIARANWARAKEYVFGVGHRGNEILSRDFLQEEYLVKSTGTRAAHNTSMAILVDHGFPGAAVFIAFLVWAIGSLWRLNFSAKQSLNHQLHLYAAAIGPGLIACFVAGQFTNFLKAEVQIWLVALMVVLYNLCSESVAETTGDIAVEAKVQRSVSSPVTSSTYPKRVVPIQ